MRARRRRARLLVSLLTLAVFALVAGGFAYLTYIPALQVQGIDVAGAQTIYTTDKDIRALAADCGLTPVHVAELSLPPSSTPLLDAAQDD